MAGRKNKETRSVLKKVFTLLVTAPRIGTELDNPEGSRYIQLSDTLAREIENDIWEALR